MTTQKPHGKDQHVTPHKEGGWQVIGAGDSEASARTATKKEAIDIARQRAQEEHSELVIHGLDGKIQRKDSHGHDPFPPEG